MARRKTKEEVIKPQNIVPPEAYVTWGDDKESQEKAFKTLGKSLDEYTVIQRSEGNMRYRTDYSNLDGPTGGRPGLTKGDYYAFRPEEAPPYLIKNILQRSDQIYQNNGLIKNVIDLMGDFGSQGVRLVHRNKKVERFYKKWFKKVNGKERSERFLNNLYRTGNIVIDRQTAKVNVKVAKQLYQSLGESDTQLTNIDPLIQKKEIPWKYTFIDPVCVDVCGGALASFLHDRYYEIKLPAKLRKTINNPKNEAEQLIVNGLPQVIKDSAKTAKGVMLDPSKTLVFHYKKDDWQTWAFPMVYSIMDDIAIVEKLKLADMSALDGAISNIRIFKIGNLEWKIAPTPEATARLAAILGNNVGGGTMDLIWGPDIELIESNTNVHNFLGESKYIPHYNAIYAGLGIPPTLTGTFGAAGTTNNFISLKTLTQRLQYGREVLTKFWEDEIALVQKAMGFAHPAKLEFDRMDLSNEDAEKALLIQLADRNIVSDEFIQARFGADNEIENTRLNRETKARKSGRMVKKGGPWANPEFDNDLKKIALQLGIVTPSEVGLELEEKKKGESNLIEMKDKLDKESLKLNIKNKEINKPSGVPGQGRPKNATDTKKRKTKTFSPQTGAELIVWATKAQDKISELVNPILLDFYKKKNVRSLTQAEYKEYDIIKSKILFGLEPFSSVTQNSVASMLEKINDPKLNKMTILFEKYQKSLSAKLNDELVATDNNAAKASFYYLVYNQKAQ
jgi:hypothetical protein